MDKNQLQKKLFETFKVESEEHLKAIMSGLLQLEKNPSPEDYSGIIEMIHREAHSMKGAARVVDLIEIEQICQAIEKIFSSLKKNQIKVKSDHYDVIYKACELIRNACVSANMASADISKQAISDVIARLNTVFETNVVLNQPKVSVTNSGVSHSMHSDAIPSMKTVRIDSARVDSLLYKTEEMLIVNLELKKYINEFRWLHENVKVIKSDWQKVIRGKSSQSADLFLASGWDKIKALESALSTLRTQFIGSEFQIGALIENLLNDTKKVVMLPFNTLLESYEIMVRNISREQGKDINFIFQGGDVEIDKRILDELKDPLTHIIRNCIDHGIELSRDRIGKHPKATIEIKIDQFNGNEVEILITDDGRGIDIHSVKNSAINLGKLTAGDANKLSDDEVISLVFLSGVSTSPTISNVSGHGLGMAIVHEKIENIGGNIKIKSQAGRGTEIKITVPLSWSTFKGVLIKIADQTFVLPTVYLERIIRIRHENIKTVENKETIVLDSQTLSLIRLNELLGLSSSHDQQSAQTYFPAVIIKVGELRAAFLIESIFGEQDIIVKKLNKPLTRVKYISAATIHESGRPIPILNAVDLLKAVSKDLLPQHLTSEAQDQMSRDNHTILVVEDSITTRMLLKNILEMAGYDVLTAVDGADAWCLLKENEVNLVLSDVDMPKMNGYTLTKQIRSDKVLSSIPVVLVSTNDKQEDKESGIEAGANAYVVKNNFDDNNLISIIKRLL